MDMLLSFTSADWIIAWVQEPTWKLMFLLFVNIFWIPVFYALLMEVWDAFQNYTADIHHSLNRKFVFLAVDVPRDTEQTPLSMEAIFNQLAGAHGSQTWWEARWKGEFQEWFSFEIVSLEGYVQYIIRAPYALRDLVEASIYAQYPDAEISEVTDYTDDVPKQYPDEKWDMYGMEYLLHRPNAYPIKTYRDFEDKVRGELVDPMAALLEIMSKIGKGEQIWYQILAKPIVAEDWLAEAQQEIDKIVDRKSPEPKRGGILGFLFNIPFMITGLLDNLLGLELGGGGGDESKEDSAPLLQRLTPGEQQLLEDMERKNGKLVYKCLMRIVYVGRKEVFNKARGVGPVVGAIKQFNDDSRNWFKPGKHSWTKANYTLKKARIYLRQNSFMEAYAGRSLSSAQASGGYVLNTEELATIYHFPMASVRAPLVKRTGAKKSEPPSTLPLGDIGATEFEIGSSKPLTEPKASDRGSVLLPEPASVADLKEQNEGGLPSVDDSQVRYVDIPSSPKRKEPPSDES